MHFIALVLQVMMPMLRLMTPMVEEEEYNYDIDDLGKANTERKYGDLMTKMLEIWRRLTCMMMTVVMKIWTA